MENSAEVEIKAGESKQSAAGDEKAGSGRVWGKISKLSLYLLIFLLPLWFLPWTINVLDFNKQTLLFSLVFISLISFLLKSLIEGKISLNLNIFNLTLIVFLPVLGLSTIFSSSSYASFWGWPLPGASSFFSALGFVLLYFLIVNVFKKEEVFLLLLTFISATFLAALFGIFQIFGVFILPFDFSKISSFNTIGELNSFALFFASLLPLIVSLIFTSRKLVKFWFFLAGLTFLFLLFLVNFWASWIALLAGSALILIFGIARRGVFQANWLILPMILLVVSLLFGAMRLSISGLPAVPLEVSLSHQATLKIAFQTLKENAGSFFLGSGPGTFVDDYTRFKSSDINQTAFWAVRFQAGASEILDKAATTGVLGFLSYLLILGVFGWFGFKRLTKKVEENRFDWLFNLGILASWLSVAVSMFLYPVNMSLVLLFWLLTAVFIGSAKSRVKSWTLEPSSIAAIGASFVFILILIFGIGLFFLSSQRYVAQIRYFQGLTAFQRGDNTASVDYLLKAANLNPKNDLYWRDLSQIYLVRLNEAIATADLNKEEDRIQVQSLVGSAVNSASQSAKVSPSNVANWNVRGFVYKNMIGILGGADDWAIKSYEEAAKLEPASPYILGELGAVYLIKSDILARQEKEQEKTESLTKAKDYFDKAIGLKSDYTLAHYQIAMIHIREGKIKEAIDKLEATKQVVPLDTGLAFQLGLIYYSDNQFGRARGEFERTVALDPNHSNAHYFLGLIYDREGNKEDAREQFEKVSQLNPDNEEVKKILANLRAGKPALEGIVPAQPPIGEKPPEGLKK